MARTMDFLVTYSILLHDPTRILLLPLCVVNKEYDVVDDDDDDDDDNDG